MEQGKNHEIPTNINLSLCLIIIAYHSTIFIAAPWMTQSYSFWAYLLLFDFVLLRLSNVTWHLTHESVHGHLVPNKKVNLFFGRALATTLYSSFTALQLGHLTHHKANRISDISDLYFEQNTPKRFTYYLEILGGHYLFNAFLLCFLCFLPKVVVNKVVHMILEQSRGTRKEKLFDQIKSFILNPKIISRARKETLIMLLFFSAILYGFISNGLAVFFLLNFIIRAVFFSYLNNMPHYGNELDNVNASTTAWLPKPLSLFYLNFNYHKTHHELPNIPWNQLPKYFKKIMESMIKIISKITLNNLMDLSTTEI